jgi:hypothetical protein
MVGFVVGLFSAKITEIMMINFISVASEMIFKILRFENF